MKEDGLFAELARRQLATDPAPDGDDAQPDDGT